MKKTFIRLGLFAIGIAFFTACSDQTPSHVEESTTESKADDFVYMTEQFSDFKIIRYQIPGWDALPLNDKKLAYYLAQAGLAGRDIIYDQNYRNNLAIRRALEKGFQNYNGDKSSADWKSFEVYMKEFWLSNGIHHAFSHDKLEPGFSREFLSELLANAEVDLSDDLYEVIFDPAIDAKKVTKSLDSDMVLGSAVNYYDPDITHKEVEAYYKKAMAKRDPQKPILYGLNAKLVKEDGKVTEKVYKVGGMYGAALEKSIEWLELAKGVADNAQQEKAIGLLIDFYRTGDLHTWDEFNIAWVQDTTSNVDFIQGFIEVYNDPIGYHGSYESIVQIKDLEASEQMKVLSENAQFFEDNSPIQDEHKKAKVVGITYNFINVVSESGDASPTTPIGVNLPNSNWIRAAYGSKSISLGNIVSAYAAAGTKGLLEEFAYDSTEVAWAKKYGDQASKLHTALHEVVGHASGQLSPGVGTPKETLKNYASTLEEGRADLVALYYIMDPKLVEIGVMDNLDVGRQSYNNYIKNGMMLQMRRLKPGAIIEGDHMRNRQLVASWVYEKGKDENVISKIHEDGKTYFKINDYDKLRTLFGELLREIQRIKSEGDYEAGKNLVETYGVQVDPELHAEVLERSARFDSAPYGGFINPVMVPVVENGEIVDIKIEYPDDFSEQMLFYAREYTTLPDEN